MDKSNNKDLNFRRKVRARFLLETKIGGEYMNKKGFTRHHLSTSDSHGSNLAPSKKSGAGFTLIELLVVIAIIGILAAIAMVNLNSAREKARIAAAKGTMNSLQPVAVLCLDGDGEIEWSSSSECNNGATDKPVSGEGICSTDRAENTWPDLPTGAGGWAYGTCDQDTVAGTWSLIAHGDGCVITCTQSGCEFPTGC